MKVVILEDKGSIRFSLKRIVRREIPEAEIFTAQSGVEGLGLIYISKPQIIVVDSTLPKYAGVEILEYIRTNEPLRRINPYIFVLTESKSTKVARDLPKEKFFTKDDPNFVREFSKDIREVAYDSTLQSLSDKTSKLPVGRRVGNFFTSRLIFWANSGDKLMGSLRPYTTHATGSDLVLTISGNSNSSHEAKSIEKPFFLIAWIFTQIMESIYLTLLTLFTPKVKDANLEQERSDLRFFRVRYYPTLTTFLASFIFLLLQVLIFVAGGIVILGTKVNSIFADYATEVSVSITAADYNPELIKVDVSSISLNEIVTKTRVPAPVVSPTPTPESTPVTVEEVPTNGEEILIDVQPTEPEVTTTPEDDVLGVNTETQEVLDDTNSIEVTRISYSATKPSVVFNTPIDYDSLYAIYEESSVNTRATSKPDVNATEEYRKPRSISELGTRSLSLINGSLITYQLSPDKLNWYYFSGEGRWEQTIAEWSSSNTVQEVNQYINIFNEQVGGSELFIKAFLHSDGLTKTTLKSLTIERSLNMIYTVEEVLPQGEQNSDVVSLPVVSISDTVDTNTVPISLFAPRIYQASFANGNKVVYGKIQGKLEESNLNNYKVRVYYTDSVDYSKNATNKSEFIGETAVEVNASNELTFLLITPNRAGGYVTAELVYVDPVTNTESVSGLSNPVENSTFTVDSTGDEVDASAGNGVCLTAGGTCTLRAAIQEANALAGSDNIYFNIPTSDAGYRDFDDPDTASSGDSLGGDDYWTIRPATELPDITTTVTIDGTTQTTNQSDTNTSGPEIQLNGINMALNINTEGFHFNGAGSSDSSVNGLNINGYYYQIRLTTVSNFTLTRNYLGTAVNGLARSRAGQISALYADNPDNLVIGTSTSNGNVIAGFDYLVGPTGSIGINCSAAGIKTVSIAGNIIGLGADGITDMGVNAKMGIEIGGYCALTVGGNTSSERNIIANAYERGIRFLNMNDPDSTLKVYNNFFGTDTTGSAYKPNLWVDIDLYSGSNVGVQEPNEIGASGKGNFFASESGIWVQANRDTIISYNTFANNSTAIGGNGYNSTQESQILNNYFALQSDADPYFGLSYDFTDPIFTKYGNKDYSYGAWLYYGITSVKGNYFKDYAQAISLTSYAGTAMDNTEATIGGTNALTGSLCNGLEQNCFGPTISTRPFISAGIAAYDSVPQNVSTLYADNDFTNYNSDAYKEYWTAYFELFSGTERRTDLTSGVVTAPIPQANIYGEQYSTNSPADKNLYSYENSFPFYNVDCFDPLDCPLAGSTNGEDGKTMIATYDPLNAYYTDPNYYYDFSVIIGKKILQNGTVSTPGTFKFDTDHFSSQLFSFDGSALTHAPTPDRGEKWTVNDLADGDIPTQNFSYKQIMEVDYVDANPILQQDGSYIINVDSYTTEDNVSITGVDGGEGAYTGGGIEGVDGLSDGSTSLIEAVIVAKKLSADVTIKFTGTATNMAPTTAMVLTSDNNSNTVIIDGEGTTQFNGSGMPAGTSCIEINGAYNLEIRGITFVGCKESGIKVTSGAGITISTSNVMTTSTSPNALIDIVGGTANAYGETANDADDSDVGPNNLMNFPTIQKVTYIGGGTYTAEGVTNNTEFPVTVDLCYSSEATDLKGGCISSFGTTTTSSLNWSKNFTVPGFDGTNALVITALATNTSGSTGEFAEDFVLIGNPDYEILLYPITLTTPLTTTTDSTPLLQWQANGDPDLASYEIYLDGNLVATVDSLVTQYQVTTPLSVGNHYWQVIGIRQNATQGGTSSSETFAVTAPAPTPTPTPTPTVVVSQPVSTPVAVVSSPVSTTTGTPTPTVTTDLISDNVVTSVSKFVENLNLTPAMDAVSSVGKYLPVVGGFVGIAAIVSVSGVGLESLRLSALIGLLFARKKKFMGIVIDGETNEPIPFAVVKLKDITDGREVRTITDPEGRYTLLVPKIDREYAIEVQSEGYSTVQKSMFITKEEYTEDFTLLKANTPDANGLLKVLKKFRIKNKKDVASVARDLFILSVVIGFLFSVYAFIRIQNTENIVILFVYMISTAIFLAVDYITTGRTGVIEVIDAKSNKPVMGAIVKFFAKNELVDIKISDNTGRVNMKLSPAMEYFISVSKPGFALEESPKIEKLGLIEGLNVAGRSKNIRLKLKETLLGGKPKFTL